MQADTAAMSSWRASRGKEIRASGLAERRAEAGELEVEPPIEEGRIVTWVTLFEQALPQHSLQREGDGRRATSAASFFPLIERSSHD
ncbi:MAG: hypothetical protein HOQ30_16575 [Gemmatimonadaceae bacterium]|nr:hypothetical protein [Gemmatimonadaceae bacterium]